MNRHIVKRIVLAGVSCLAFSNAAVYAQQNSGNASAQDNAGSTAAEEITVIGVRSSLQRGAEMKRRADQIIDAISAEAVGKLPDANVAEALQRVTGLQIDREETGEGSGFQVRGLIQNRVEINGATVVSSNEQAGDRTSTFDTTSSALFKSVQVIKSQSADMIEGAIGATIRLETFKPLDFKRSRLNLTVEGIDQEKAEKTGGQVKTLFTDRFDVGGGEIGYLVNLSYQNRFNGSDIFSSGGVRLINPALTNSREAVFGSDARQGDGNRNNPGHVSNELNGAAPFPSDFSVWRPGNLDFNTRDFETINEGFDGTVQWRVNSDLEFTLQATLSNDYRENTQSRLRFQHNNRDLRLDLDPSTYEIELFNRPTPPGVFSVGPDENNLSAYTLDTVTRGILTRGRMSSPGATAARINSGTGRINNQTAIRNTDKRNITFKADWQITDTLNGQFALASSMFKRDNDNMWTNMDPRVADNDPLADPDGNQASGKLLVPDFYYDFGTGNELPTVQMDFGLINAHRAAAGKAPADLTTLDVFAWHQISGTIDQTENSDNAIQFDFDWDLDKAGFTILEFGARYSRFESERSRLRFRHENAPIFTSTHPNFIQHSHLPVTAGVKEVTFEEIASFDNGRYAGLINGAFISGSALTSDLGYEGHSGDFARRWPVPTVFSHTLWTQIAQEMFADSTGDGVGNDLVCVDPNDNAVTVACVRDERGLALVDGSNIFSYQTEVGGPQVFSTTLPPSAAFIPDPLTAHDISESISALYLKGNFEGSLFDMPFYGNVGVRLVRTEYEAFKPRRLQSLNIPEEEQLVVFRQEDSYTNVLPSANINFGLSETMYLRFAVARAMTRPNPIDLVPGGTFNGDLESTSRIRLGNPELTPFISDQFDASWEWYPSKNIAYSASVFYKDLKDFMADVTQVQDLEFFAGVDLTDGIDGTRPIAIVQRQNEVDGKIHGLELAAQAAFDFLPSPFDGFGVVFNYTYTDSEQESKSAAGVNIIDELTGEILPIEGRSENSANFILYYEKYGFSFRAAYNWRDEFLVDRTDGSNDALLWSLADDGSGLARHQSRLASFQEEYGQLDLSTSYRIMPGLSVFLQARDVLEQPRRRFVGDSLRLWEDSGTLYRFGVRWTRQL